MTIIKKFEPDKEEKSAKWRFKKIIVLMGSCLLTLIVVEIWVSRSLVTSGEKFKAAEILKQTLALENQILENEIASQSALVNIASHSASLGFHKPKNVQYIR